MCICEFVSVSVCVFFKPFEKSQRQFRILLRLLVYYILNVV